MTFLREGGAVLETLELDPPDPVAGRFFELSFVATFAQGTARVGTMSITDGTSNTILVPPTPSNGIIAILIGMRQARGMGTMQVLDSAGQIVGILPYIEQNNLFQR